MTLEDIESACFMEEPIHFARHSLEVPDLTLRCMFYPLGFPTVLRTNSHEVLSLASDLWSAFEKQFDTKSIRIDVHVIDGESLECPPAPVFRIMHPLLMNMADTGNYSATNLETGVTQIVLNRGALRHSNYLKYFLLGAAPLGHIATRFATPVHAGCVVFEDHGILLCGDSGAGKSSLSYACARTGWTYVTDDASYLLNNRRDRIVTGNCHQVRFRPSAAELFPEVAGVEITPRAAGKPSIELPTAPMPWMICAPTAQVQSLVFLNRRAPGPPELVPYRKDVARYFMRQVLFGSEESLIAQCASLERLLTADIFELRYSDLDWAVERLEKLAREGR